MGQGWMRGVESGVWGEDGRSYPYINEVTRIPSVGFLNCVCVVYEEQVDGLADVGKAVIMA